MIERIPAFMRGKNGKKPTKKEIDKIIEITQCPSKDPHYCDGTCYELPKKNPFDKDGNIKSPTNSETEITRGTIKDGEYHPSADGAMIYIKELSFKERMMATEALASTALSGNRLAEICLETMNRLDEGKPVSDRYVLGLAWALRDLEKAKNL